ncbi:hypothetical protein, partial [Rhodococcus opacus]|uniref:hypothetical protein n=1 Tax=Rhodococcus opacus TaxID=37919 RepID=UPI0024BA18CB
MYDTVAQRWQTIAEKYRARLHNLECVCSDEPDQLPAVRDRRPGGHLDLPHPRHCHDANPCSVQAARTASATILVRSVSAEV